MLVHAAKEFDGKNKEYYLKKLFLGKYSRLLRLLSGERT